MPAWPGPIQAITLLTEDLAASRRFYEEVFALPVHYADESSAVFLFGTTMVNLLDVAAAPELLDPAPVGGPGAGPRAVMTIGVDDVDATCARLAEHGVPLLNGPVDRPWGPRTASFRDPSGHVWEIAH